MTETRIARTARSPRSVNIPTSMSRHDHPPMEAKLSASEILGTSAVVVLLFIGFFKGAPFLEWIPIDLTVVCVGLVCTVLAAHILISRGRTRVNLWALAAVALALPAAFYPASNPAVLDKRIRLLIPLIAVVAVCYLVRSERAQKTWVWLHVVLGVALVATGVTSLNDTATRFAGAGSNTIGAGRASGVAVLVLLVLLMTGGFARWWTKALAIAVAGWLATALISTGSRGPVFACAAAILLVATLALGQHRKLRFLTALGSLAAGWLLLNQATGLGATRLINAVTGQQSLTAGRSQLWAEAGEAAARHPLGIGWGNFWAVLPPAERQGTGYVQYPHNFVLEVVVEAGWLAGIGVTVFVVASLIRLHKTSNSPYGSALLGIAIFFVLNGLVSGNINDNRLMWAALAIAWVRVSHPPESPGVVDPLAGSSSLGYRRRSRHDRLTL